MVEDDGMGGNSIVIACIGVLVGELDRAVVITVSASDGSAVGTSKCMFFMKHLSHIISCFLTSTAGEDYVDFTQIITTIDLTFKSNIAKRDIVSNEQCVACHHPC